VNVSCTRSHLPRRFGELVGVPLSAKSLAADLVIVEREYRDAGSALGWPEYHVEWFLQKNTSVPQHERPRCNPDPLGVVAVGG